MRASTSHGRCQNLIGSSPAVRGFGRRYKLGIHDAKGSKSLRLLHNRGCSALDRLHGAGQPRLPPAGDSTVGPVSKRRSGLQLSATVSRCLARIIHDCGDTKSLFCYKHVVATVLVVAREAFACPTIARHSVCCSPIFFPSLPCCSSIIGRAVPMAEPCC